MEKLMLPKGGGPRAQKAAGTLSSEPSWDLEAAWAVAISVRVHRGPWLETARLALWWLSLHR